MEREGVPKFNFLTGYLYIPLFRKYAGEFKYEVTFKKILFNDKAMPHKGGGTAGKLSAKQFFKKHST